MFYDALEEGALYIVIYSSLGGSIETEDNLIDFSTEDYLIIKDSEESARACTYATFTVNMGSSAQTVGNNAYFSNSLKHI